MRPNKIVKQTLTNKNAKVVEEEPPNSNLVQEHINLDVNLM
jgi:hypothetical protein